MDTLKYNFAALTECSTAISTFVGNMHSHLREVETRLENQMNTPGAEWSGEARAAYVQAKIQWDAAATKIEAMLGNVSGAVRTSCEDMSATERMCANMYQ